MKVDRLDRLTQKIGGRFKLTALLQKRLEELVRGSPPLVDLPPSDYLDIALQEIEEGRIELTAPGGLTGAERLPLPDDEKEEEEEA